MKSFATAFIVVVGLASCAFPQDNLQPRRDAYAFCQSNMRKDPNLAYRFCKEYLEKYPGDDYERLQAADKWLKAYERVPKPSNPFRLRVPAAIG